MKSLTDYSPDDTASVRTMTWFSQPPARTQSLLVFWEKKQVKSQSSVQFWEPYVFSGSFTSTMAAFTALEFYTILYAVGHGKKKEHFGETTKKYCIKAHNVNLCCNCFIWSFLVEADKAGDSLHFPVVPL